MDLLQALGDDIRNEFDSKRELLPRAFFYGPAAARQLAEELKAEVAGRTAVVLFDVRTRAAAGEAALAALRHAGWTALEFLVPDGGHGAPPVCDDVTKDRVKPQLPRANVMVAVGSGVINDLTKWLAAELSLPYAVYATAASMNGYTAANVAPAIRGVKSLFRASAPRVVAADPRVVEQAPFELTTSGLGDVIAKPVSTADWVINHRIFGEAFSPAVAAVINRIEPSYLDHPDDIAARGGSAVRGLMEALVYSGCAMTLQGSSLPASGGEHLISHALDMMAHVDGIKHDLHGRQVGVGTIFAAECYRRVLAMDRPVFRPVHVPFDRAVWGPIADAVAAEHSNKLGPMDAACRHLNAPGNWEAITAEITPILRRPETIKDCLRRAGAAHRVVDLGIDKQRFLTAVRECAAIRRRFTSMDLAWAAGVLPGAAEEIVHQWLE